MPSFLLSFPFVFHFQRIKPTFSTAQAAQSEHTYTCIMMHAHMFCPSPSALHDTTAARRSTHIHIHIHTLSPFPPSCTFASANVASRSSCTRTCYRADPTWHLALHHHMSLYPCCADNLGIAQRTYTMVCWLLM